MKLKESEARNEIRRTYIKLDRRTPCMIYEPLHPEEKSKIAVICMHSDDSYFEFAPTYGLAQRGYRVITSSYPNPGIPLDEKILQVKKVFEYIREYPGVEKVLLLGHSGGATLMTTYQMTAENGCEAFQGPEKNLPMEDLGELPKADGLMLLDANFGNGVMTLLSLDPAIIEEGNGMKRDPSLDMFNPENGYGETGCHFSDEFIHRFWKGQAERMNHLIDYAKDKLKPENKGNLEFDGDEPLLIAGGTQYKPMNKIFPQMPDRFFSGTEGEWPLLHKDRSITVGKVPCLRAFFPGAQTSGDYRTGCLITTLQTFLRSSSVRVDPEKFGYDQHNLYGIDWDSSYCCTTGNAAYISSPMLIMGMTGSYEYIASELIYKRAVKCSDKTLAFVEGASHNFEAEHEIEKVPGQYGDTAGLTFDYVDEWIRARYI